METFMWPIIGGVMIGMASVLLMWSIGKIAGISGILWSTVAIDTPANGRTWRFLFVLGLVLGTLVFHLLSGRAYPEFDEAPLLVVLAGLLVGIGVKVGNGCTSGHGVCGIGRLSIRSLSATIIFMLAAIITVAFTS